MPLSIGSWDSGSFVPKVFCVPPRFQGTPRFWWSKGAPGICTHSFRYVHARIHLGLHRHIPMYIYTFTCINIHICTYAKNMYIYIHVHAHIHMHTHMHIHLPTHVLTRIQVHIHTYACTCTCRYTCTHIYIYVYNLHIQTHTHAPTQVHIQMNIDIQLHTFITCICLYMHIRTYIHVYIQIHISTHRCTILSAAPLYFCLGNSVPMQCRSITKLLLRGATCCPDAQLVRGPARGKHMSCYQQKGQKGSRYACAPTFLYACVKG